MCMRIVAVTMDTGLLIFCACVDNHFHVALLFINEVGGSRRGLSIRLSGLPRCPDNGGPTVHVIIINVVLISNFA